jgi:hypothetical protein
MGETPRPRTIRGTARVTVIAHLAVIRTELEQGWTAKAIYDRHADKLAVMSYPQFARYVRQLKDGSGLGEAIKAVYSPAAGRFINPSAPESGRSGQPQEESHAHAGQQSAADAGGGTPRTFKHDPQERPGDYERLFGEPRKR